MAKRPSLADLAQRKPSAGTTAEPQEAVQAADAPGGGQQRRAGAQPDGRKGILVRVQPQGWRALRDLSADLTISTGELVTMQSLIVDAINDLLRQNGRPPVA